MPNINVTLQSSDGFEISTERDIACQSLLIKDLLDDLKLDDASTITIPLTEVSRNILENILEWCALNKQAKEQSNRNESAKNQVCDETFFEKLDKEMVFKIIYTADYMEIQPLLVRSCEFALTIDPDLRKGSAAWDSLPESTLFVVETILLQQANDKYDSLMSILKSESEGALRQLQELKTTGVINEDLSISVKAYRNGVRRTNAPISERLDVLKKSRAGLEKEIVLLEKTIKWASQPIVPLAVGLGLSTDAWMR